MGFMLMFLGPIFLFILNRVWFNKPFLQHSFLSFIIYGMTVLNWAGLVTVALVRKSVGCSALSGECYAEGYFPDFDMVYILSTLSSLLINVVCVILIVSILLKTIWSRRFNA